MKSPIPGAVRIELGLIMRLNILWWVWGLGEVEGICAAALVVNLAEKTECMQHLPSPTQNFIYCRLQQLIADNFSKNKTPIIICKIS